MKLNTYKNQKEIEKTFTVETYDLMFGTVEDILGILDGISDKSDNIALLNAISENRDKLNKMIFDIFPDMTQEDLRKVKVKDLVPFFVELFAYVGESFKNQKN